jgi:SPP1 gp7 family putative phage head morphogenesis protein
VITREQYIRRQQIIQNRMMKVFVPKVEAALLHQIDEAIHAVRTKGIVAAQGNINGDILNAQIGKVVTELYSTAAALAFRKYKPNVKAFGVNIDFVNSVIEYLKKYLLEKVVVPISQTTIDSIESVLQQALKEGWGVDETVKHLEDEDPTKFRARLIVRTETVKATNITQLAAADNEDYEMEKMWIAIEDNRTRKSHSHAGVDGERVDLDQPYSNGLMFPGDPTGGPEEVCNCRCTQGYFAKRDLDGKLIPKKEKGITIFMKLNLNKAA